MIRIGPAGWNYKDWAGIVYPQRRPKGFSEPGYLADYFDTLEINTSFYGPPRAASAAGWLNAVAHNPKFRFTAKMYRAFTHDRKATPEDERLFKEGMEPLAAADRLGALLLQFPISFRNTPQNVEYVANLKARFRDYPVVLEVRHQGWADAAILDTLAELGIGLCNIDQPLIGKGLGPSAHATSDVGYVRLHGRNYKQWFSETASVADRYDYLYSTRELEPWADRVRTVAKGSRDVYAITNNHHVGKAIVNAVQLTAMVTDKELHVPLQWSERYAELRAVKPD